MFILVVHEMGHYIASRRRYLAVTLPYFIPAPPPLGTFGAFIKIRSPIPNKRVLVEVGAWGPVAGAIAAIPMLLIGLFLSEVRPGVEPAGTLSMGSSILVELFCFARFGDFSFNSTILLHPTAWAAWFGLFVTAMNLLPMGQLDGGHVIYALFGPAIAKVISLCTFLSMIPMGLLLWPGWFVFGLLAFFIGLKHPPPLDPYTPLSRKGRILGWAAVVLFLATFIPVPIRLVE